MTSKRNVKRSVPSRQQIVRSYNTRQWYELADWAVVWFAQTAGWAILALVVLLTPIAVLGLVLGINSLPLQFLGVASTGNNLGWTAIAFLIQYILLVLAIRPLFKEGLKGWYLVLAAATLHLAESLFTGRLITGVLFFIIPAYIYWQIRHKFR